MLKTSFGTIMQHGYVVSNLEAAAADWSERMGVGPFYILDHIRLDPYYLRGVKTVVDLRIAMSYWGNIQIELIQPLTPNEPVYSPSLKISPNKLHHCATQVDDLDALLAANRLEGRVLQSGSMPTGLKFAYLDQYMPDGGHLELIQSDAESKKGYGAFEAVCRSWDGTNPVRPMSAVASDVAALMARQSR